MGTYTGKRRGGFVKENLPAFAVGVGVMFLLSVLPGVSGPVTTVIARVRESIVGGADGQ